MAVTTLRTSRPLPGVLLDELQPYAGRLEMSLRMALSCVLVVLFSMSQQVPEAALSCYLVFFASRDNAGTGILIAAALIIAASVGIVLGLVFLQLASGEPMLRLALMALFTFAGMFFSQASRAGPIAATVGFVFAFVMTLNDFVPVPELLSRGLSWVWVIVAVPMAALIVVNALLGPNPMQLARQGVAERLRTAARLLTGSPVGAAALLDRDVAAVAGHARVGGLLGYGSRERASRLAAIAPQAQTLLALAVVAPPDAATARKLARLADEIESDSAAPTSFGDPGGALPGSVGQSIADVWRGRTAPGPAAAKASLLAPDAFTNPVYTQFALKTLIAVLITYAIYTAWNWFEIHTAMITCFYVALASTGETLHKAALRIAGCLIGAVMGVGAILLVMPHITDIGQLLLLVGAGSLLAAWVANGSSLVQYMGWQMALAFFLCVLQGFGPSFGIDTATNRVLGIVIGNVVVAVVFLSFWPVTVTDGVARQLASAIAAIGRVAAGATGALAEVRPHLAEARRLQKLSAFEGRRFGPGSPVAAAASANDATLQVAADICAQLALLRERERFIAGAPIGVRTALKAVEAAEVAFLDNAGRAMVDAGPKADPHLERARDQLRRRLEKLVRSRAAAPRRARYAADLDAALDLHRQLSNALEEIGAPA